jgi:hypothetical protein
MSGSKHYISIWFFIGALLFVYGAMILGAGIYSAYNPPAQDVVLSHLHAAIWWGGLLLVIGGLYCYHFLPGRNR